MNKNPVIKTIYNNVFGDHTLDTKEEQQENLKIINDAMNINVIDTVTALFENGPLEDGDIPSKGERDWMLDSGYCSKVVVNGRDGSNACTHKGAWLYRAQRELYKRFQQGSKKQEKQEYGGLVKVFKLPLSFSHTAFCPPEGIPQDVRMVDWFHDAPIPEDAPEHIEHVDVEEYIKEKDYYNKDYQFLIIRETGSPSII